MKNTHVLITGGAGFIGSHLVERLLGRGATVTVIDDLSTGSWSNLRAVESHPGFRAVIASASERALVADEVGRADVVYHLASAVGVKLIVDRPVHTVETIYETTESVLSACARFRKRVVVTSTSEVYGKSTEIPFNEGADVVMGPTEKRRWAYACAKALDEFLALAHHHESQLPVFLVRLFNTVGPRQTGQYGMVLPRFVTQALRGEDITVYGTGQQRRCFCHVHDVLNALERLPDVPAAAGKVINVGSQEEVSIEQLARRVIDLTGSSSELRYLSYEEAYGPGFDDMERRVPDLGRANALLGWAPTSSLDEIIRAVADDVRSRTG